jgi:hypothetical protein
MSDEEQVESSATETAQVEQSETSAETQNTEAADHMIPKSRFDEVIGQRNDARRENEQLQQRLDELAAKIEQSTQQTETRVPDESSSEEERIKYWVEKFADPLFERRFGSQFEKQFGMTPEQASTILGSAKSSTEAVAEMRWREACSKRSLDPVDQDLQLMVMGLTRGGMDYEKALDRAQKLFKKDGATKSETKESASVEKSGVTGGVASADFLPWTKKEAAEGAAKNKRAKHLSTVEIIERRLKRQADANKR